MKKLTLCFIVSLTFCGSLHAQWGSGFDGIIKALVIQEDGKSVVGGRFSYYNNTTANRLIRLHPNGRIDKSFYTGKGFRAIVPGGEPISAIVLQPDGKLFVGGDFVLYNEKEAIRLIRLHPDGSIDHTFSVGSGFNSQVSKLYLQPDGKLLVGGRFTTFQGAPVPPLIRLNQDGSRDLTFDPESFAVNNVKAIGLQPDAKVLVNSGNNFFRLHPDGTRDNSFEMAEPFGREYHDDVYNNGYSWINSLDINSIIVEEDGKILLGGDMRNHPKSTVPIMRLNTDGSRDESFTRYSLELEYSMLPPGFTLKHEEKIYTIGLYERGSYHNIHRLHPDGSIDRTFKEKEEYLSDIEVYPVGEVLGLQKDGKILMQGSRGGSQYDLFRLNTDGSPDLTYNLEAEEELPQLDEVIRINSGGPAISYGEEQWQADHYFSGGRSYTNSVAIANTDNDALYQTERNGDFTYEIPVPGEGYYTVELHFAEIHWDRPRARLFDLILEDVPFVSSMDLVREYGANYAQVVKVEDLKVTDGKLTVELLTGKDRAKISGIAVFKQEQAIAPGVLRINAGGGDLDYGGEKWASDRYYSGGLTNTNSSKPIANTAREELYQSERYGQFNYSIPVPEAGLYTLELHFAEIYWDQEGSRVFDVSVENCQYNMESLDLIQRYNAPNVAAIQFFQNIEVTDGALDIELTRQVDNATISGIAVYPQTLNPNSPVVTLPEDVTLDVGQEWNYKILATSPVAGENLTFTAEGLPDQLNLNPASGLISGSFPSAGSFGIVLRVTDQQGLSSYATFTVTVSPLTEVARINSGGGAIRFGEEQWQADHYYTGGRVYTSAASISNTDNDLLYQSERNGDFTYNIPVPEEGYYTVELHFAEIHWQRSNARLFNFILENGQPGPVMDLFKDHGGSNSAHVLKADNIHVVDGELTLELITMKDRAKISGIAVYKQSHPYLPERLRINAGGPAIFHGNEVWMADNYFEGGRIYKVSSGEISNTDNDALYHSERFGEFNYRLPAPEEGLYTVELHFAEIYWDREGARVFSVEIEDGQFVLENLDLYKDHGGMNAAHTVIAENIEVTDGELDIQFSRQVENPKLSGLVMYQQPPVGANARLDPAAMYRFQHATEELGVSSTEMEKREIKLYPNPAKDKVNLDFYAEENGEWSFVLVNSQGTSTYIQSLNLEKGRHLLEIDLSTYRLSAGSYYLQIMNERGLPKVLRMIIY